MSGLEEPKPVCAYKGCHDLYGDQFEAKYGYCGRHYCILHLPNRAKRELPADQQHDFQNALSQLDTAGNRFEGLQVPMDFVRLAQHLQNCVFIDCHFDGKFIANTGTPGSSNIQNIIFQRCVFKKEVSIPMWQMHGSSEVIGCEFYGNFDAQGQPGFPSYANFSGSIFRGNVNLSYRNFSKATFTNVTFYKVPNFGVCEFRQNTDFHGVKFKETPAEAESAFRMLRVEMEKLKARYYGGMFYTLEKRCERKKHPYGIYRLFSALYDYASQYGADYERAFWALILYLVMFLDLYSYQWSLTRIKHPVMESAAFWVSQLVRPFELFSLKVTADVSVWIKWEGFVQSIGSFIIIALFSLALRWNFRRE